MSEEGAEEEAAAAGAAGSGGLPFILLRRTARLMIPPYPARIAAATVDQFNTVWRKGKFKMEKKSVSQFQESAFSFGSRMFLRQIQDRRNQIHLENLWGKLHGQPCQFLPSLS